MEDISLLSVARAVFAFSGVVSFVLIAWTVLTGLAPVLFRLGKGLKKRRIAIFANTEVAQGLVGLLTDSKLFSEKQIVSVTTRANIGRAENASLLIVHWPDFELEIADILRQKKDRNALIVYAPSDGGRITQDNMRILERERNVIVNNFRGRLMNDIVSCMITTGYEKE